jgi:hypothetical protein
MKDKTSKSALHIITILSENIIQRKFSFLTNQIHELQSIMFEYLSNKSDNIREIIKGLALQSMSMK